MPESGLEQPVVVKVPATNPAMAADMINVLAVFVIMILICYFVFCFLALAENMVSLDEEPALSVAPKTEV